MPTDRGEVMGLHVIVHDPLEVQLTMSRINDSGFVKWIVQKIGEGGTSVFNSIRAHWGRAKLTRS